MTRSVALVWMLVVGGLLECTGQEPQIPATTQTGPTEGGRVVRDPTTGKTFYQQWVTEAVTNTRWENKPVTTTVYETEWINTVVPSTQTVLEPQVQQVPQAYWKGAWNPFQQPTLAYKYVPVTTWVPKTTTVNQVVPRQQMVPKQQTINVPQPVTETKNQQRLVQTEISQPGAAKSAAYPAVKTGYTAHQPPAIFNIPMLARQPFTPPANQYSQSNVTNYSSTNSQFVRGWTTPASTAGSGWSTPQSQSQIVAAPSTGLRPVTRMLQSVLPTGPYQAPMSTATAKGGSWNVMQAGMQPTVLR